MSKQVLVITIKYTRHANSLVLGGMTLAQVLGLVNLHLISLQQITKGVKIVCPICLING